MLTNENIKNKISRGYLTRALLICRLMNRRSRPNDHYWKGVAKGLREALEMAAIIEKYKLTEIKEVENDPKQNT